MFDDDETAPWDFETEGAVGENFVEPQTPPPQPEQAQQQQQWTMPDPSQWTMPDPSQWGINPQQWGIPGYPPDMPPGPNMPAPGPMPGPAPGPGGGSAAPGPAQPAPAPKSTLQKIAGPLFVLGGLAVVGYLIVDAGKEKDS